jgi:hypothetical protein
MRRPLLMLALLMLAAAACMIGLAAPPSLASTPRAAGHGLALSAFPTAGYLRDGNGAGDVASLKPKADDSVPEPLYAIPVNGGAWKWIIIDYAPASGSRFTYGPLSNATQGDQIYVLQLLDAYMCMANSAGVVISEPCEFNARQEWVYDPPTGYWINIGRSNDQNNWEVLCNPGGGGQLVVTTRDQCSDYHEEWYFNDGS